MQRSFVFADPNRVENSKEKVEFKKYGIIFKYTHLMILLWDKNSNYTTFLCHICIDNVCLHIIILCLCMCMYVYLLHMYTSVNVCLYF